MAKINNIHQLSTDLLGVYSSLKDGNMDVKKANGLANVAEKVISSARVMLSYNKSMAKNEKIALLENKSK